MGERKVYITGIDTYPRSDHVFRSPGRQTTTALTIDLHDGLVWVRQKETGTIPSWRESFGHDVTIPVPGHPMAFYLQDFLSSALAQELMLRMCDGYRPFWGLDGEHIIGFATRDACGAFHELVHELAMLSGRAKHYTMFKTGVVNMTGGVASASVDDAAASAMRIEDIIRSRDSVPDIPVFSEICKESDLNDVSGLSGFSYNANEGMTTVFSDV